MTMLTTTNIQWSQFQQMLKDYVENVDFCYYSWECFASIVQQLNSDKTNVYMFTNLLGLVKIPAGKKEDDKLLFQNNSTYIYIYIIWIKKLILFMTLFIERPQFKFNLEQIKIWVTTVWNDMKPFMLSNIKIRREMLTLLIEKILMNLINPLVNADFLMDSMDTRMFKL